MFVWVAMTVVMVGWDYQRGTEPPAVIAISLRGLSSIKQGLTLLRMPGVNRQGQAHIMATAILSPRSCKAGREVEATPWFRTWFSIDPQPASISPTINISIVFICAFLVDCGRIICHPAIKNGRAPAVRSKAGRVMKVS